MNWSKTKNIFIICFLLLDVFLAYQLFLRQQSAQDQSSNQVQENFNEYVKDKNIKINTQLPDRNPSVHFLSGAYVNFTNSSDQDLQQKLTALAGPQKKPIQTFSFGTDKTILQSTFSSKVPFPKTQSGQQSFLTQYVYQGDNYRFWSYDKADQIYKFIQTYNGHPVFSMVNGKLNTLDVSLTKDGNYITGYVQSYITVKPGKPAKLGVQPMDALQKLWNNNKLQAIDQPTIEKMELGYINISENNDQPQTLSYLPAWYVEVKTKDVLNQYFVTGINGEIQSIDRGK